LEFSAIVFEPACVGIRCTSLYMSGEFPAARLLIPMRVIGSYGLARMNNSIAENGFNSRSVQKGGVLSLQSGCGALFRPAVKTHQPFTDCE
jgi:hypothetical protein